jgi:hypothetical protein
MSDVNHDLLKKLWQQQPVDREVLTSEAIRKRLTRLERSARYGTVVAGIAVAIFALIIVAFIATDSLNTPRLIGYGMALAASAWGLWVIRKRGRVDLEGVDHELVGFVDYAIAVHERQLDMGISPAAWRSVILRPSILASLVGLYVVVRLASEDWPLAAFVFVVIVASQWLGYRGRKVLRDEIDNLKALRSRIVDTL